MFEQAICEHRKNQGWDTQKDREKGITVERHTMRNEFV